jgi:hypothetical protein
VADTRKSLVSGGSVVLDATGSGQVQLGPDSGPANWSVSSVVRQTNRPGQSPVPRVQLYLDTVDPQNSLGVSYDGSFGTFVGEQTLSRGQHLLVVWTGGQAGDRAAATVNGEKW